MVTPTGHPNRLIPEVETWTGVHRSITRGCRTWMGSNYFVNEPYVPIIIPECNVAAPTDAKWYLVTPGYCETQLFPSVDSDPYVNVTLIKRGYLGSVPTYPTTLFSLETLEDYRLERLQCGRWSFLHKAKVLCHKHNVSLR